MIRNDLFHPLHSPYITVPSILKARHGGWWRYERRHEDEIEEAYQCGARCVDMLIAGSLYRIDLENMRQYRKDRNR